jgi:ubiquinone/menaquinone biosynthesis C-methylase UbiE
LDFRGHCIRLSDGRLTLPDKTPLQKDPRVKSALQLIKSLFVDRKFNQISLCDYGCYEGGFAVSFAQAGLEVTGIEGREQNLERCLFLKKNLSLKNLTFLQEDVASLEADRQFDISFVSGLLYHLEDPVRFINYLGKTTNKLLILNTHFAGDTIPSRFRHKLSPLTKLNNYRGRWYTESQSNSIDPEFPRSALHNHKSFWLTKESLLEALRAAGFTSIFEQYDCHLDFVKGLAAIRRNNRSQFIAVK